MRQNVHRVAPLSESLLICSSGVALSRLRRTTYKRQQAVTMHGALHRIHFPMAMLTFCQIITVPPWSLLLCH